MNKLLKQQHFKIVINDEVNVFNHDFNNLKKVHDISTYDDK